MTKALPEAVAAPLDLANLDTGVASDNGAEIELLHPTTNAPLDIFISILGKDSQAFREYVKSETNANIRREAMAKRRGREAPSPTAEDIDEKAVELLVLCSTGWRSGDEKTLTYKGENLPFTVANAKRIYTEQLWIRRQVDEAIGDLENFMKP